MPSIEFDDDRPLRSRDELLATVRRDGLRRRYRRNGLVGGLALVLIAALAVPVLAGGGDGRRTVAAVDEPTTIVDETTTTSVPEVVAETTTTIAVTMTRPVTATTRPTATTTPACRNSRDERCGTFRWDPDPGANVRLTAEVTVQPAAPRVGQAVTFTVVVVDTDAAPISDMSGCGQGPGFGDGVEPGDCMPMCARTQYGPWSPPARQRGEKTFTYTHTYDRAGSFPFWSKFGSAGGYCSENPYADVDYGRTTVTVTP